LADPMFLSNVGQDNVSAALKCWAEMMPLHQLSGALIKAKKPV
jgi:hypothetical protein